MIFTDDKYILVMEDQLFDWRDDEKLNVGRYKNMALTSEPNVDNLLDDIQKKYPFKKVTVWKRFAELVPQTSIKKTMPQ